MAEYLNNADSLRLRSLKQEIGASIDRMLGYPLSSDFDYAEIYELFTYHLNNAGDPYIDPDLTCHTKALEREVIDFFAQMLQAPGNDYWGYVTSGGTEGNLFGLYLGRKLLPDAVVYHTTPSHYSVRKSVDILSLPSEVVSTQSSGEMNYADLRRAVGTHRGRAAIILANIGSTMSEAKDNVEARTRNRRYQSVLTVAQGVRILVAPRDQAGNRDARQLPTEVTCAQESLERLTPSDGPAQNVVVARALPRPSRPGIVPATARGYITSRDSNRDNAAAMSSTNPIPRTSCAGSPDRLSKGTSPILAAIAGIRSSPER